ncbi:amidophosphoribosyltransferase, partial [Aerococcus urinae]|nr:amidophosphoribosyltransferase [Aerococcus urinae]
ESYDLPHEECGLIGVWNHPDAARLSFYGLMALQHRGQEGAGITSLKDTGRMQEYRGLGLVSEVFSNQDQFDKLAGQAALGHVRYAT